MLIAVLLILYKNWKQLDAFRLWNATEQEKGMKLIHINKPEEFGWLEETLPRNAHTIQFYLYEIS